MDLERLIRSASAAAVALLAVSCAAPTPQSRIARHPEDFAQLSTRQQRLVESGQIERGMSKPAVYFAWGSPERARKWVRNGVPIERWTYFGYEPVYRQNFGLGVGWGSWAYGGMYDPFWHGNYDVDYLPYPERRVDFRDDRVVDWEALTH